MTDAATKDVGKRDRSPKFPYIGLAKALERIEVLYSKVKRSEARIVDISKDWGVSATSSATDRTVAAIQSFGLVEDAGSGENRKIKLSEFGARILADARPGVRESLLSEAALKPAIIAEYARRWSGGRPDDAHALSQLQFEGGFTADGAKIFLRVFDETIRFSQTRWPDKAPDNEVLEAPVTPESEPDKVLDERAATPLTPPEPKSGMKQDVFSLREGNVVLQWPDGLSAESYQDLEDWTKLLLRKIKRGVKDPGAADPAN